MSTIDFYKHQVNKKKIISQISRVLKNNIITSGEIGEKVEKQIARFFNAKYCLLTNSWTNGAIATLLALQIKQGDEIIVPAMTFVATANIVELVGAKPVFVDVNPNTLLIDEEEILKKITRKTKAIIPVHLYGAMLDIKKLKETLKKNKKKITIIEDAAHCFEGKYNGEKVGKYSDISIFSFYATKNITCAEGGAIITNNKLLFENIKQTRTHGINKNFIKRFYQKKYSHWDMKILGTKANLPDLLACMLPSQIKNVYKNQKKRKSAYQFYNKILKNLEIKIPTIERGCSSAYHLYVIHVKPNIREKLLDYLNSKNISCAINYRSISDLTYYKKKYKLKSSDFKNSKYWGDGTISLPFYPDIKKKDQERVAKILSEGLKKIKN
jgi:UDP-4-amino-4-deoxy-L-arabinose-oxoglutarate aminotransferase